MLKITFVFLFEEHLSAINIDISRTKQNVNSKESNKTNTPTQIAPIHNAIYGYLRAFARAFVYGRKNDQLFVQS
jgi:hypothetical protein